MGLRGKITVLFLIAFCVTTLITVLLLQSNLQEGFLSIERQQATNQMAQLGRNLNGELDRLKQTTYDWSSWDDIVNYLEHPSKDFTDKQIPPSELKEIDIKFLALIDNHQHPQLVESVNMMNGQPETATGFEHTLDNIAQHISSGQEGADATCGVDNSAIGPLLLCWHPIKRSEHTGKSPGTIVLGRMLNSAMISKIQKQGNLRFELTPIALSADHPSAGAGTPTIEPQQVEFSTSEPGVINGVLKNFLGEPILTVHLQFPTEVSKRGAAITWRAVSILLVMTALTALILFAGVQSLVTQRIKKMGADLNSIWRNGRWAGRLHSIDDKDELNELAHAVNRLLGLIRKQTMVLETMAVTDSLTKIGNRRAFEERILIEMSLHKRNKTPLALVMINVDQLKQFNDQFGHPAGDEILVEIGKLLTQVACRPADLAVRISEERFAIILPATEMPGAIHVAQILKSKLSGVYLPHSDTRIADHISLGIGITCAGDEELSTFMQRADQASAIASQDGQGQVVDLPIPD